MKEETKKRVKRFIQKNKWGYVFVLPLLTFLAIFSIIPFFYGIIMSFYDVSSSSLTWKFVGFNNYIELFKDGTFWTSCRTMAILLLPKLIIGIFVPFIFAEIIMGLRSKNAQKIYRIMMLLPIVAPGVVGMLIWKNIYASDGLINSFLKLFNPDFQPVDYLNSDDAIWKTIVALIFLGFPWIGGTNVLIYLSGLMNINREIYEASEIDGCTPFARVFKIDMPLCLGQFRYFLIFGIINGLQDYGIQMVLYKVAPDYVYVPGFYLYQQAYTNDRSGYAASIGVCLFIVILALTILANYLTNEKTKEKRLKRRKEINDGVEQR